MRILHYMSMVARAWCSPSAKPTGSSTSPRIVSHPAYPVDLTVTLLIVHELISSVWLHRNVAGVASSLSWILSSPPIVTPLRSENNCSWSIAVTMRVYSYWRRRYVEACIDCNPTVIAEVRSILGTVGWNQMLLHFILYPGTQTIDDRGGHRYASSTFYAECCYEGVLAYTDIMKCNISNKRVQSNSLTWPWYECIPVNNSIIEAPCS
jgi:hypothetical protein